MLFWHKFSPCVPKMSFVRMIGRSVVAMFFEIISPIVVKYPELKPAQLK